MSAGPVGSALSDSSPRRHLFYLNTPRTGLLRTPMGIKNVTEKECEAGSDLVSVKTQGRLPG